MVAIEFLSTRIDTSLKAKNCVECIAKSPILERVARMRKSSENAILLDLQKALGVAVTHINPRSVDTFLVGFSQGVALTSLENTRTSFDRATNAFGESVQRAAAYSEEEAFAFSFGAFLGSQTVDSRRANVHILRKSSTALQVPYDDLVGGMLSMDTYLMTRLAVRVN
mgnify:CR=1 FL=1